MWPGLPGWAVSYSAQPTRGWEWAVCVYSQPWVRAAFLSPILKLHPFSAWWLPQSPNHLWGLPTDPIPLLPLPVLHKSPPSWVCWNEVVCCVWPSVLIEEMLEDILLVSVAPSLLKVDAASLSAALVMRWNRKSFGDAKYKAAVEPFQSVPHQTQPSACCRCRSCSPLLCWRQSRTSPAPSPGIWQSLEQKLWHNTELQCKGYNRLPWLEAFVQQWVFKVQWQCW